VLRRADFLTATSAGGFFIEEKKTLNICSYIGGLAIKFERFQQS
jgi:hypothetical protein